MKNTMPDTDLLFAGGGLSGLSLAWHIETAMPGRYRMFIVDREQRKGNDRTWCFWEKTDGPFQSQVLTSWDTLQVKGQGWEKVMDIRPYRYKMIRSAALYAHIRQRLEATPGIRFVTADILGMEDEEHAAALHTSEGTFRGKWLFNSAIRPEVLPGKSRSLIQHFKGYFLRTPEPFFNPGLPLFMDFRVEQGNDVRFVYVLPLSETEALAEFTIFSPSLWEQEAYEEALNNYLSDLLNLGEYSIEEKEFGAIPMTDHSFPLRNGKRILNLGTAGGMTKASTGYTFVNVQRHTLAIADCLKEKGHPFAKMPTCRKRYHFYDAILLDVLTKNRYPGSSIFSHMFLKNTPERVFDFLGEDSRFAQELRLFTSFPQMPFVKGFLSVVAERLKP